MPRESTPIVSDQQISVGVASGIVPGVDDCLRRPLSLAGASLPNRVFLAPLSGISDVPFRRLARRFGAGAVVSEMVASAEFVRDHPESRLRATRDGEGTHIVQLAGRDPSWMRAAAERLAAGGVDVIDINMGCPAKKVVGGLSGSALMREPDLALRIVEATVAGAGTVPVTLKMRLGWDEHSINAPAIARKAEAAGIRMVTVHGRTRMQFYSGGADWTAIRRVKDATDIPVVANGDLTEPAQASAMLDASGADAVMIGRGAQGRPWLPGLVAGACDAGSLAKHSFADLVEEHHDGILAHYGELVGIRAARKHLGWYLDRFALACGPVPPGDRQTLFGSVDARATVRLLRRLLGGVGIGELERSPRPERAIAA